MEMATINAYLYITITLKSADDLRVYSNKYRWAERW